MLIQILTHTPYYVWLILAVLVYRGVVALRDREVPLRQLFIIPAVMLVLSLQDIAAKFGAAPLPLAAWAGAAGLVSLLIWRFGSSGISAGAAPGNVRVHGSWVPLAMMMAIFFLKYAIGVTLVIRPGLAHDMQFAIAAAALFGVFNGYFLGGLARNLKSVPSRLPVTAVA